MITVYVLKSLSDGVHYVGMAKNATFRLKEHNTGKNRFTKGHLPWTIIYTEQHPDWESARVREKYLKTNAGKVWLGKHQQSNGGMAGSPPARRIQAGRDSPYVIKGPHSRWISLSVCCLRGASQNDIGYNYFKSISKFSFISLV